MGRVIVGILLLGAFCLGAALSYFNWVEVPFHYLAGQVEVPLIALLLAGFVLGAVTMLLLNTARIWNLRLDSRRLGRQLRDAETELRSLRNLPIGAKPAAPEPATPKPSLPPPVDA